MLRCLPLVVLLSSPAWATSLLGAADGTHGLHLLAQAPLPAPSGDPRGPLRAELEQLRDVPSLAPGIVMAAVGYPVAIFGTWLFFAAFSSLIFNPVGLTYGIMLGAVALAGHAVAIVGTVLLIKAIAVRSQRGERTQQVEEELERLDRQLGPLRPVVPGQQPPPGFVPDPYPQGVSLPVPPPALALATF